MFENQNTFVIWNPSAGSTRRAGELKERLQSHPGIELLETESRDDCLAKIREKCVSGSELVLAAGGDGTVSTVLEGIMRCAVRPSMGILPLGTGNDFSRSLGLEQDPARAWKQLQSGSFHNVDVMQYRSAKQQGWSLNMLTGGNTGIYMRDLTDDVKRRWGPFCYLRGVIQLLPDLQVFRLEVTVDEGRSKSFDALNFFVANGRMSGGGMCVCPKARFDDGQLDLIVIEDGLAGEIALLSMEYLLADYLKHDLVHHLKAQSIRIDSNPPMLLTADGDRIGETSLQVEVLPGALSMLVPATGPRRLM